MTIHFANTKLSDCIAETWRLTSSFTGSANPVVNWEVADQVGGGSNGYTVCNESSGIFTFNQTGWYHCVWWMYFNGNTNSEWNEFVLQYSWNNGSNYESYQYAQGYLVSGLQRYNTNCTSSVFSIPSISGSSTRKLRFSTSMDDQGVQINGSTTQSHTGFTIMKIADID